MGVITISKKPLTKEDLRHQADQILDPKMYTEEGYHQYIRGKDLTLYTLIYGMDINFVTKRGFLGIGKKTVKKTLLSRLIRNGIYDVWVYFPPHRKTQKDESYYGDEEDEKY